MKVGLIDVDGHNFPNLPLMKLSAYHKRNGDAVEWYNPLLAWKYPYDRVYMSKVFTFTPDYLHPVNSREIIHAGTGYFNPDGGQLLPPEIEHIYPNYGLYPEYTKDTAYGFLSRGCPRGCGFCIVGNKEGRRSRKVANLSEFWHGQKNIVLLDPNTIACPEWEDILQQLIDSDAWVDFSQGVDIRLMTDKKAEMIKLIKVKNIHFAWDRYEDKDEIIPKLRRFKKLTGWDCRKMTVYILVNYDTNIEQDLERIYTIRDMGYWPYVMIYDKEHTRSNDTVRKIQRWVNMRAIFATVERFEDYMNM